jgi:hypothetical protein
MRQAYQACSTHSRTYCQDSKCKAEEREDSNAGSLSVNTDGGLSIGLGGGLAIDPSDGSIGFQIGGITIDT